MNADPAHDQRGVVIRRSTNVCLMPGHLSLELPWPVSGVLYRVTWREEVLELFQ